MNMQQQVLKQELTISQILHEHGKKFTQVREQYSDGNNGRCTIGVLISYFGWDGNTVLIQQTHYILHYMH